MNIGLHLWKQDHSDIHYIWVVPVLLSQPDQSQHSRLHSVEVQGFLGCIVHRSQRQWLPWDDGEKLRSEEQKWEQATSSNGFKAQCAFSSEVGLLLGSTWFCPGLFSQGQYQCQQSLEMTVFKPAECVTVYLQVFVTNTWKLSVFFLNVCLSLTRALMRRLWQSSRASALKLRIHLFCVQPCCLEVLALPLTPEVMLALDLLTTPTAKPKGYWVNPLCQLLWQVCFRS